MSRILPSGKPIRTARAGNVKRLKTVSRAYASAVRNASRQYDGSNGRLAVVMFARIRATVPLLSDDGKHTAYLVESANPLPDYTGD